jgi:hypothetical protein
MWPSVMRQTRIFPSTADKFTYCTKCNKTVCTNCRYLSRRLRRVCETEGFYCEGCDKISVALGCKRLLQLSKEVQQSGSVPTPSANILPPGDGCSEKFCIDYRAFFDCNPMGTAFCVFVTRKSIPCNECLYL